MPKSTDDQALVVNCSSLAAEARYVAPADVDATVAAIAQEVADNDARAVADWHAQQAERQRQQRHDLDAHAAAQRKRVELAGKLHDLADRDPDLKLILQAVGLVGS